MKIDKIKKSEQPGCVVGIGSSAGGLEALQQFLTFLPADTGMAFVVIQHLSPDHRSLLADILGKYTTMPVMEAQEGMHVRKNTVYMLPPKYNMEIEGGVLHLHEYNHQHINHPIDVFFRSLAKSYENRAVAMILSGTGSDGTNGIRSIKERNGMIIAQSPESAKFDGMPRSAIATGFVDLILNPDSIAREMAHISRSMADAGQRLQLSDGDLLSQVFSILKNVTNVNYSYYKQTTVLRRIERRIVVTHNRNLREYVNYMSNNPEEARLLAKEVLIGVTSFFRDQDYFDVLKELGNIGAGNATTALAQMIGTKVDMSVPQVRLLDFKDVGDMMGGAEQIMAGIYLAVEGDIDGSIMFLLGKVAARHLVDKLMGTGHKDDDADFDEVELSALKEVGNIITGSYLNSLSMMTNLKLVPSIPFVAIDMAGAILSVPAIQFGMMGDKILLIENQFFDEVKLSGYFIMLPDVDGYKKILSSLGITGIEL